MMSKRVKHLMREIDYLFDGVEYESHLHTIEEAGKIHTEMADLTITEEYSAAMSIEFLLDDVQEAITREKEDIVDRRLAT